MSIYQRLRKNLNQQAIFCLKFSFPIFIHCPLSVYLLLKSLAPIPESEEEAPSLEEIEEEAQPDGTRTQSEEERKVDPADEKPEAPVTQPANTEEASANTSSKPQGWEAIPKPKGHSGLDYSRWDRVEDDSSEEEEDDKEDQQPQYKFRVRTVGVKPVK